MPITFKKLVKIDKFLETKLTHKGIKHLTSQVIAISHKLLQKIRTEEILLNLFYKPSVKLIPRPKKHVTGKNNPKNKNLSWKQIPKKNHK